MFEIVISCVIFLAMAYWAVLRLLESLLDTIKQDLDQLVRK